MRVGSQMIEGGPGRVWLLHLSVTPISLDRLSLLRSGMDAEGSAAALPKPPPALPPPTLATDATGSTALAQKPVKPDEEAEPGVKVGIGVGSALPGGRDWV